MPPFAAFATHLRDGGDADPVRLALTQSHPPTRSRDGIEGAHRERSIGITPTE
jgi:hypothetical protein